MKRILFHQCISFILLCILLALIWIEGPTLYIGGQQPLEPVLNRAIINTVFIFIWFLSVLLKSSARTTIPKSQTKTLIARELLVQQFQGATAFLKRTLLNNNASQKTLSDLPWYLLIGASGAGKTTLLAKSDMSFILAKQSRQSTEGEKVNPTELCDWWASRQSVFLDTTGRFCPASRRDKHEKVLWHTLLSLIKQEGQHHLKGVIVVLDLPMIIKQPRQKSLWLCHNTGLMLSEIKHILNQEIPVYIVGNQCDRILGFETFFGDLGQEEREQIWGITFSHLQPLKLRQWMASLNKELSALLIRLHEQVLWRLHHELNSQKRLLIKDFPTQLERVFQFITPFFRQLAATAKTPWIRGIYFTSNFQTGNPEDYLIGCLQQKMELRAIPVKPLRMTDSYTSRAFFSKDFLQRLLAQDQTLVPAPASSQHLNKWRNRFFILIIATFIVTITITGSLDLQRQIKQIDAAEKALTAYQTLTKVVNKEVMYSSAADRFRLVVSTLQAAEEAAIQLHTTKTTWIMPFLDKRYRHLNENADLLYSQALQELFAPQVKALLQTALEDNLDHIRSDFYGSLEAYLMLSQPEHLNKSFVIQQLSDYWQQLFPADLPIQAQLRRYTADWLNGKITAMRIDEELLAKAQAALAKANEQEPVIANLSSVTTTLAPLLTAFSIDGTNAAIQALPI